MNSAADSIERGIFVQVGGSFGVVVGSPGDKLPDGSSIPEDHCLVWYGQTQSTGGTPRCRTVPWEYCIPQENCFSVYH